MPERGDASNKRTSYGVEAELERLLRCPECGGDRVRPVREAFGGYGVFGLKALGDLSAPKQVRCRNCGHEWLRPPMKELRREAERRIDERYDALEVEDDRLRRQLQDYLAYQRDIDRQVVGRSEAGRGGAGPEEPDSRRGSGGEQDGGETRPAAAPSAEVRPDLSFPPRPGH